MIFQLSKEDLVQRKAIYTATEIQQQPQTWMKTLGIVAQHINELQDLIKQVTFHPNHDIILTGAGSSEFVGNAIVSYLTRVTGYHIRSVASTDIVATPKNYLYEDRPTLLISFGRSGNSPESIGAIRAVEAVVKQCYHLIITCNPNGQMSDLAEVKDHGFVLQLPAETHDKSFAMTSSYSNMYLAALLALAWDQIQDREEVVKMLAASTTKFLSGDYEHLAKMLEDYDFNRIVYLGSNTLKGVAQECALKMLELTAGNVTTMHDTPLGFRHGPKSVVNDRTLVVMFVSDDAYTYRYEVDLIKEMVSQNKENKLVVISNHADDEIASLADCFYQFNNSISLDNVFLGLNDVTVGQTIAFLKSLSLGCTPDNPFPGGYVNRVVEGVILYPYSK